MADEKLLKEKIVQLEKELADREQDLATFRVEVGELNKQLSEFINRIRGELQLASHIHNTLVPTEIPNIPGFEFSTKYLAGNLSGGDYFDIFELEDRYQFGVLMSAASGYGMSAVFLSVLMKLSSQLEARKGRPPNEAIQMLAKEMGPAIEGGQTSSVFYGLVDRRHFELNWCLVGDIIAFVHRQAEGKIESLKPCAPAISKDWGETLEVGRVALDPRDRLVVVSPGILEIKNANGESFGEERLVKAVLASEKRPIHDLRNEIVYQAKKFRGKDDWEKDLTVIVVEAQDRVIKLARK